MQQNKRIDHLFKNDEALKQQFAGKRVRLIKMMDDHNPVEPGTEGDVGFISAGTVHVKWDNGRHLALMPNIDKYEIINE